MSEKNKPTYAEETVAIEPEFVLARKSTYIILAIIALCAIITFYVPEELDVVRTIFNLLWLLTGGIILGPKLKIWNRRIPAAEAPAEVPMLEQKPAD